MGRNGWVVAVVCVVVLGCFVVGGCKETPTEPKPKPAPKIDGDLSDDCWKGCEVTGDWTDVSAEKPVKVKPTVYVTCDEVNLYVAVLNPESDMKDIVAEAAERDGPVWTDDSNEVFIDPTGKREDYYQVIVNTKGVVRDAKTRDTSWNCGVQAAVRKMDDAWSVELAIPLADLGVKGSPKGQTWGFNFCRNRRTGSEQGNQAWADTGPSFHNPQAFKNVTLK